MVSGEWSIYLALIFIIEAFTINADQSELLHLNGVLRFTPGKPGTKTQS